MIPIMRETYEGVVDTVGKETVTVIYDVNGNLVEQTYEKSQFINRTFPKSGTCVKVRILLCEYEPPEPELPKDEKTETQRKPLIGPVEF